MADTVKKSETAKSEATAATAPVQETAKDKVGDILRKERLTRRITIETIAKDLKLNVGYIKALEASDYESLPAAPYIRVYIKSLTKYLSLDSDSIMKEFYRERGLIDDEEKNESNKIDISVRRQERNPTVIVAIALVVALAIFTFVANQKGLLSQAGGASTAAVEEKDSTDINPDAVQDQNDDSLAAYLAAPETTAAATTKTAKQPPRP